MRALMLLTLLACGGEPGPMDTPRDTAASDTGVCPVSGFGKPSEWSLPETGVPLRGVDDATCSGPNDELSRVVDLTGDQRPDLVRLYGCDRDTDLGDTHWLVHENLGDGFSETPRRWPLPDITESFAFHEWQDGACEVDPDHLFGLHDLTGDRRPDLIILSDCDPASELGTSSWQVFANTGEGFAPEPVTWSVPGEFGDDSWRRLEQTQCQRQEADLYGLHDLDGDERPELVRFAGCPEDGGIDHDGTWRVWKNEGDGFAGEPEVWTLPTDVPGGWESVGSQNCMDTDDHLFVSRDMNGDQIPDLVVTSFCDADPAWDEHWRVYFGTGNGFDAGVEWAIPEHRAQGAWQFLLGQDCVLGTDSKGGLIDLDGDGLPDLIRYGECWEDDVPRTWVFHRNLGDGFATTETLWWLPDDNESLTWTTLSDRQCDDPEDRLLHIVDMTGDQIPDVVETYGCDIESEIGLSQWRVSVGGCL